MWLWLVLKGWVKRHFGRNISHGKVGLESTSSIVAATISENDGGGTMKELQQVRLCHYAEKNDHTCLYWRSGAYIQSNDASLQKCPTTTKYE